MDYSLLKMVSRDDGVNNPMLRSVITHLALRAKSDGGCTFDIEELSLVTERGVEELKVIIASLGLIGYFERLCTRDSCKDLVGCYLLTKSENSDFVSSSLLEQHSPISYLRFSEEFCKGEMSCASGFSMENSREVMRGIGRRLIEDSLGFHVRNKEDLVDSVREGKLIEFSQRVIFDVEREIYSSLCVQYPELSIRLKQESEVGDAVRTKLERLENGGINTLIKEYSSNRKIINVLWFREVCASVGYEFYADSLARTKYGEQSVYVCGRIINTAEGVRLEPNRVSYTDIFESLIEVSWSDESIDSQALSSQAISMIEMLRKKAFSKALELWKSLMVSCFDDPRIVVPFRINFNGLMITKHRGTRYINQTVGSWLKANGGLGG